MIFTGAPETEYVTQFGRLVGAEPKDHRARLFMDSVVNNRVAKTSTAHLQGHTHEHYGALRQILIP
jgi:hypothetical protein